MEIGILNPCLQLFSSSINNIILQAKDKGEVTQEMKEYLTQSLEAVASEVAIFSHTFLRLLDSQADLLDQLTSCGTLIAFVSPANVITDLDPTSNYRVFYFEPLLRIFP